MDTNIESLRLAATLRNKGIKVIIEMNKKKIKKALDSANKNNIPYVIILGQNEINNNTIEIKDMNSSTNIKVDINDIDKMIDIIKKL